MAQEIRALSRFVEKREPTLVVWLKIDPWQVLRALQDGFTRFDRGRGGPVEREEADDGPDNQGRINCSPSQRPLGVDSIELRDVARSNRAHGCLVAEGATSRRRRGHAGQR